MRYLAKPFVVNAFKIVSVQSEPGANGSRNVATEDGNNRNASATMLLRRVPVSGDYWIVREDGYEYLESKAVFERSYALAPEQGIDPAVAGRTI